MLAITSESIETLNVTVQDTSGALSTLDGTSPSYIVVPVDATTGVDKSRFYAKYHFKSALNSGMMVQCLIDTANTYIYNTLEATNAPMLPVTITAGSNDTWKLGATSLTIPAGTYTTLADLAAAFELSVDGSAHTLYSATYGLRVIVTDNGKLGLYGDINIVANTAYNTTQILNGVTHNALPTIGFTNAQTFPSFVPGANNLIWPTGRYSLYIAFTSGSEKPILGPVSFSVN